MNKKNKIADHVSEIERLLMKAEEISTTHRKAQESGVTLLTLADFGIHLGPDAPPHLKERRFPGFTLSQWDQMATKIHDRLNAKGVFRHLPPGAGITFFYANPAQELLLVEATPVELTELWDKFFYHYPDPTSYRWHERFHEVMNQERVRRGMLAVPRAACCRWSISAK